jgi:hypothetical protein
MMGRALVGASIGCWVIAHVLKKARANEEDDVMLSASCGTPPDGVHCAPAAVVSDTPPLPIPCPLSSQWVTDVEYGINARVTHVEDGINAFVTDIEDGINAFVTDVEDGINAMVTDVEDGVTALVTDVEDGVTALVSVVLAPPPPPPPSSWRSAALTAFANFTPPAKQLDALSNVYEAIVQPTAEKSILSNPPSIADVPTDPSASQSVNSVQAQPKFEQTLQNSKLSELQVLRELADLYKSQRDEALDALQKAKKRVVREDCYDVIESARQAQHRIYIRYNKSE